jgi:hypothetical protein
MAFAQISGARLPLCSPRIRGVVFTTLQDSNNATDRSLARPQKGLCRGASTLRISPRAGHQLHSCLVTTVAGLPPASQIRFPGRTKSQTTSASTRRPAPPATSRLTDQQAWTTRPLRSTRVTRIHSYYETVRPCTPHRYSPPHGFSRSGFSLQATSRRTTLLH